MKQSGLALLAALLLSTTAHAQIANDKVKIGVLSDLSGIYESGAGNGSVEAVKMAVEEFGGRSTANRSKSSPATIRTSPTSALRWPTAGTTSTRLMSSLRW